MREHLAVFYALMRVDMHGVSTMMGGLTQMMWLPYCLKMIRSIIDNPTLQST
jgi:hypothetical protein